MSKSKKTTFLTYRKQLLGLAKLYSIDEIKSYFKSKKKLTTSQLELLLIKNKIKLPIKKSFLKFKISKIYLKEIYYMLATCVIVIGFFGGIPQILEIIKKMEPTTIEKISVDKVEKLESDQVKKKSEKTLIDDAKEEQEGEKYQQRAGSAEGFGRPAFQPVGLRGIGGQIVHEIYSFAA